MQVYDIAAKTDKEYQIFFAAPPNLVQSMRKFQISNIQA